MNHRGFVQVCKFRHVVRFVKLGRVDSIDIVYTDFSLLRDHVRKMGLETGIPTYAAIITLNQNLIAP